MFDRSRKGVDWGAQVLILGFSVRAAAFSARRAGFCPVAADCFRDEDLAAICDCRRIDRYPADLEHAAQVFPNGSWLYTGGLENYPDLVDRLAQERVLYGNPGSVLRAVRDPFCLAETLRSAGLPTLRVLAELPQDAHGQWLRKPRDSCGGLGIEWAGQLPDRSAVAIPRRSQLCKTATGRNRDYYYQQYVSGTPCSAMFVGARGRALWLGTTEQLIGEPWTGAQDFQYAGSLGPCALPPGQRQLWKRIGNCLAERFGLRGLFGVDAVQTQDAIWVVEVNPRYTASLEVLELATGTNALVPHVAACRDGELPAAWPFASKQCVGKAILYAQNDSCIPADFCQLVSRLNQDPARPTLADLPPGGYPQAAGQPVLTVLAYASSLATVRKALRQHVATIRTALSV
jgi:uncharacterized protein